MLLASLASGQSGNETASIAALKRDVLQGLLKVEDAYRHVEGEGILIERSYGPNGKNIEKNRAIVRFARRGEDVVVQVDKKSGVTAVYGVNARYKFWLERSAADKPFELKFVGTDDQGFFEDQIDVDCTSYVGMPFGIGPYVYSKMMLSPGFLIKLSRTGQAPGAPVRMDCHMVLKVPNEPKERTTDFKGYLLLSQSNHWAVSGARFKVDDKYWISFNVEFDDATGPVQGLRRAWYQTSGRDPDEEKAGKAEDSGLIHSFDVTRWAFRDVPESAFTLSAFGMPEYAVTVPKPDGVGLRWRLFALAGFFAAGAVALRYGPRLGAWPRPAGG